MLLSYRDITQLAATPLSSPFTPKWPVDLIVLHCSCEQNHTVYVFSVLGSIYVVACFFALYGLKKLPVVHQGLYVVLSAPTWSVIGCWQASTAAEPLMVVSRPGCSISRLFCPSALTLSLLSFSQYFLTIEGVVQILYLMPNTQFSFILSILNSPEPPHSKHSRWTKNLFCLAWSVPCGESFWVGPLTCPQSESLLPSGRSSLLLLVWLLTSFFSKFTERKLNCHIGRSVNIYMKAPDILKILDFE